MLTSLAALVLAGTLAMPHQQVGAIRLEAESGTLVGARAVSDRPGFSGTGYVTGFVDNGARVSWIVETKAGLYTATVCFATPNGEKGYELGVNGSRYSGMFPKSGEKFATVVAGKIELNEGVNTISIERGWGYFDIDYVELTPSLPNSAPKKVAAKPIDTKATKEAKALLAKLADNYGTQTFSGQYEWTETNQIKAITGVTPAILGADLMDYSPSRIARGADPKKTTERVIDAAKRGQMITLSWHWNAPKDLIDKELTTASGEKIDARWYKGFYTNATNFDVEKALKDPKGEDYKLLIRDIDVIAVELKKLQKAKVPVLWRPLHEADGKWFWWGAKGPEPLKKLWVLLYQRLTEHHKLHNLIWVFTGSNPEWYPGDKYVDIIGIDAYPGDTTDPQTSTWDDLVKRYDGKKLLAISEFGGIPDVAKMRRFGVYWAYFVTWSGTATRYMSTPEELRRLYRDKSVSNLEDSIVPAGK